jgi:glycosyltransferase involved in cell wall biosynthesis
MQKKSPVVYIITKLELGGAQKVCLSLFHNLPERETFLISGTEGILAADLKNNPHAHLLPTFTREIGFKQILQEFKNFFELIKKLRVLKKEHPSLIVHTHSTKAGIIGRWAAFFAGIKKRVHTIHGFAFHEHQNRLAWLAIYLIELVTSFITTHFICVSTTDITVGKKLFPQFSKKHSLIRAAVAWDTFFIPATQATPFPTQAPFIFGTIACFKPQKNLFDLLRAFAKVYTSNSQVRLEIIGDGQQRPAIEAWITEHRLNGIITLHGWQQAVAPSMLNWHAFVLSSLWEGLPCAIIEARLLRLPVISYNTGGITDVIYHAKNGFIIPQKNWPALAEAMLTLSQDQISYAAMQQYPDKLDSFHHDTMLKEHAVLYQNLENNKLK